MFRRKLEALNYENRQDFEYQNDEQFKYLISWLEFNKIKHRKLEENTFLFDIKNPKWLEHFDKYLQDIVYPFNNSSRPEKLDWLLSVAIKMDYGDDLNRYQNAESELLSEMLPRNTNPLDNLDFHSLEFKNGVQELAKLLNIPLHPNHLITLEAISKFVIKKFSQGAMKHKGTLDIPDTPKVLNLENMELGIPCKDPILSRAAKIFRLLYIQDLRKFQTQINEAIVASQNVTANPKTDQSLGKVGR